MITMEELSGTWNDLKGRIKQRWGEISDDDLRQVEGDVDRVVGIIQTKTGQARAEIENTLRSISQKASGVVGGAAQAFHDARQTVQDYATQAGDVARDQYGRAQQMVRQHPSESLMFCFGTGLLMGVLVGLLYRTK